MQRKLFSRVIVLKSKTTVKFNIQYKWYEEVFTYNFDYNFADDSRRYYAKKLDELFQDFSEDSVHILGDYKFVSIRLEINKF